MEEEEEAEGLSRRLSNMAQRACEAMIRDLN